MKFKKKFIEVNLLLQFHFGKYFLYFFFYWVWMMFQPILLNDE